MSTGLAYTGVALLLSHRRKQLVSQVGEREAINIAQRWAIVEVFDKGFDAAGFLSKSSRPSPLQIRGQALGEIVEEFLFFLMDLSADINTPGPFFLAERCFVVKQDDDLAKALHDLVQAR